MGTKIEVAAFDCMGEDLPQVKNTLKLYAELGVLVSCSGSKADATMLLLFYEYIVELNRSRLRKNQQRGIEKELKSKSGGQEKLWKT